MIIDFDLADVKLPVKAEDATALMLQRLVRVIPMKLDALSSHWDMDTKLLKQTLIVPADQLKNALDMMADSIVGKLEKLKYTISSSGIYLGSVMVDLKPFKDVPEYDPGLVINKLAGEKPKPEHFDSVLMVEIQTLVMIRIARPIEVRWEVVNTTDSTSSTTWGSSTLL